MRGREERQDEGGGGNGKASQGALKGIKPRTIPAASPLPACSFFPTITRKLTDHQNMTRESKPLSSPQRMSTTKEMLGKEKNNGPTRQGACWTNSLSLDREQWSSEEHFRNAANQHRAHKQHTSQA